MLLTVNIEKKTGSFHLKSQFSVDTERFALLGASGCGKSMTLKCIAGIEKPDKGHITLGDEVLFDSEKKINVPARNRGIGYLFQNYALFPNMTVRQNVTCVAKDKSYAEELIDRFCIRDVADQYPAELSGGQSQRTALARMLATRPKVLLLDEPFSALDNYLRTIVEHEILDLLESFQGPSILVTHDRNEAYRLSDRIGVMDSGHVVEVQDRQGFFDHPITVAAARLTGCKNISRVEHKNDGTMFAPDWGIPIVPRKGQYMGDYTHVGYRAHYFIFSENMRKSTDENPANRLDCKTSRVIEDTFSVVICFKTKESPSEEPDSLLTWIVNKNEWEEVREQVESGRFQLALNPEKLMFLKGQ